MDHSRYRERSVIVWFAGLRRAFSMRGGGEANPAGLVPALPEQRLARGRQRRR
jgi:hypothetical protein